MTGLTCYGSLTGTQVVAGTSYVYDRAGRLTDLTHQRGATVIADYGFAYDEANRLTQLTTPDGTSNYSYNDRYELTSSDHSYQGDEAYNYDATGNRTSYTTGDHNRLLNDGTYSYEYDNKGNRTRRVDIATGEATEYTWDYRNRLTSIVSKDGAGTTTQTVLYAYDVYDRRLSSAIDADGAGAGTATEEHFVYDGSHIALVFDGAGNLTHRYLHGPQIDQVLAEETAGQTRWALGDHQGSVRDVIDNSGTVLNHITYDSFGQVTSETDSDVDFRFGYTGRERDEESGLYYYRARYYDPAVATFVGEDPLGFGAGDANLYRYVFNSPTNFTDPSGLAPGFIRRLIPDSIERALGMDPGVYTQQHPWEQRPSRNVERQRQRAIQIVRENASYICDVASYYEVPAEAVAGPILWEGIENPYSWPRRMLGLTGVGTPPGGVLSDGIAGKIHADEEAAINADPFVQVRRSEIFSKGIEADTHPGRFLYSPDIRRQQRMLNDPQIAIEYSGAILNNHANAWEAISDYPIRDQAGLLSSFYQGVPAQMAANNFEKRRADYYENPPSERQEMTPRPRFAPEQAAMGPWVSQYRWWIGQELSQSSACGCQSSNNSLPPINSSMAPAVREQYPSVFRRYD